MPELIDTVDDAAKLPLATRIHTPPPPGFNESAFRATRVEGGWEVDGMNFLVSHSTLFAYGPEWEILERPRSARDRLMRGAHTRRRVESGGRNLRRVWIAVTIAVGLTFLGVLLVDDDDDDDPGTSQVQDVEEDDD